MGKQEFEKFLQNQVKAYQPVDTEALLQFWREHLAILYQDVRTWLNEYEGKIQLSFDDLLITEKTIGTYSVQSASIRIGLQQAQLIPVGTDLIGTRGRVDLSGPIGTVKLILADKNATGPGIIMEEFSTEVEHQRLLEQRQQRLTQPISWVWKATTPAPRIKYRDLTQDVFLDCLIGVLNG